MADSRFFSHAGSLSLARILELTGATLMENGSHANAASRMIHDAAPLDRATDKDISFLDNSKYIETFAASHAGACFIRSKYASRAPKTMTLLISEEPYRCFALTAQQ